MGVVLGGWQLNYVSSRRSAGAGTRLLAEQALKNGACRAVGHKVAFFTAEEAAWRVTVHSTAGRAVEVHLFAIIVVDVACESSRWGLCGSSSRRGWGGDSGHGHCGWGSRGSSFVGSDVFIRLLEVLLQGPDLVLHGVN